MSKSETRIKLVVFGTGVWGKRYLTLSNNTNPKGKYLASMPHKGVGNKSCVIPRGEDGLRGLCSGLLISIVLGLQTTQKQTKILDRLQS